MPIRIQRIYDPAPARRSYRVLADRLWPRGISKETARLDGWWKDLAPSSDLRKWFNHDVDKWAEFGKKYRAELRRNKARARELLASSGKNITLLYGAKDKDHTHALVLKEFLEKL